MKSAFQRDFSQDRDICFLC